MIRRFIVGDVDGAEFPDGRVVVNAPQPRVFSTIEAMESVIGGAVQWLDPPRPVFPTLALAAVVAPPLPLAFPDFVRLLSHTCRVYSTLWTPPLVSGLRRQARPHLLALYPWLDEAGRTHPGDDGMAVNDWAVRLETRHPGPFQVPAMSPKALITRRTQMMLAVAPHYPHPALSPEALSWPSPLTRR